MQPFQKIIVPHDLSDGAAIAVEVAADLARRYQASVEIVHVYQPVELALPDGFLGFTPQQTAEYFAEAERRLEAAVRSTREAGVREVTTVTLMGFPAEEIVAHAGKTKANLIVMGTHGRHGIAHVLLGSVAEKVVRSAPCPVLTVRQPKS